MADITTKFEAEHGPDGFIQYSIPLLLKEALRRNTIAWKGLYEYQ